MPSSNKNKGFAIPGELGRRLAHASNVGVLVLPTNDALAQIEDQIGDKPEFQRALDFVKSVPKEGTRIRCGQLAFSERTHSIIERNRHTDTLDNMDRVMLAPVITAPKYHKLVAVNVAWVEYDLLVRYSGSTALLESRAPGVNTWSFIAEKSGAPRDGVKRAFFTAIYGISSTNAEVASAWKLICAQFPELSVVRDDMQKYGPAYMQRRASDWRSDLYEKVIDAVDFPVVLVGPGPSGIYLEVPNDEVYMTTRLINSIDPHIDAQAGKTLASFGGVYTV